MSCKRPLQTPKPQANLCLPPACGTHHRSKKSFVDPRSMMSHDEPPCRGTTPSGIGGEPVSSNRLEQRLKASVTAALKRKPATTGIEKQAAQNRNDDRRNERKRDKRAAAKEFRDHVPTASHEDTPAEGATAQPKARRGAGICPACSNPCGLRIVGQASRRLQCPQRERRCPSWQTPPMTPLLPQVCACMCVCVRSLFIPFHVASISRVK